MYTIGRILCERMYMLFTFNVQSHVIPVIRPSGSLQSALELLQAS